MTKATIDNSTISANHWQELLRGYEQRIAPLINSFRQRRRRSQSHPIHDFLFVYYRLAPAKLLQWHPGVGIRLERGQQALPTWFKRKHYEISDRQVVCNPSLLDQKQSQRLEFIRDLLASTQSRKPNFACFGMHEWAMVYRGSEVRHEGTTPLRLSQSEIDRIVETRPIFCSHFDAFRFFAIDAKPLNRLQPTLDQRVELEQPGCIHANMDLYKWAFKSMPWVGSQLLEDCFQLAMAAREMDMRASPYDLSAYGEYPPIRVDTAEGRQQYEQLQRDIHDRALRLRHRLIEKLNEILK
ncbi:MAG: 3-methyladenine DNA glycosylase [Planctomycetota bacterium]